MQLRYFVASSTYLLILLSLCTLKIKYLTLSQPVITIEPKMGIQPSPTVVTFDANDMIRRGCPLFINQRDLWSARGRAGAMSAGSLVREGKTTSATDATFNGFCESQFLCRQKF